MIIIWDSESFNLDFFSDHDIKFQVFETKKYIFCHLVPSH